MRLSDYVVRYLRDTQNIDTIFTVSGGGCIFLIDSLGKTEGVKYIANHHEQASTIAAEGYSRISGKLGVCIVTSGPGGTNTLTGVLGAWLDSVPILIISGNVNKDLTDHKTRQLGDQEFDIVNTVKSMTKYAVKITSAESIKYQLDKACFLAFSGRPGPVWIDIPLDIQSAEINPEKLPGWNDLLPIPDNKKIIREVYHKLSLAKKPLIIVGNGVRISKGIDELKKFINEKKIPLITAVNGNDIINDDYPYYCGRFGTHAQIAANSIINEADFILSIGSRLYVRQIGYNFKEFAKNAYKVYVDIDKDELDKKTLFPNIKIESDASLFLKELNYNAEQCCITLDNEDEMIHASDLIEWRNKCRELYNNTPTVLAKHRENKNFVSNYHFIEKLQSYLKDDDNIVTSDGSANVITMQVLKLKGNQRLFTNTGCAAMGYGLPAAIGAASTGKRIICIEGDGSLHLNIHELATMIGNHLPIKLILLNNQGYSSIKQTQNNLFKGHLVATNPSSGVTFPNFRKIADAYDIPYLSIRNNIEIDEVLTQFLTDEYTTEIVEVFTDPNESFEPKVVAQLGEDGKFIPGELHNIKWL